MNFENNNFSEIVKILRRQKSLLVKDLIEKIKQKSHHCSPAYITRIEQYGEIPSPEFICCLAEILDCEEELLLEKAKKQKIAGFTKKLDKKYQEAVGLFRKAKKNS